MIRLTTDNPDGNLQNALNLFYVKDHDVMVRGGGPGPEYPDVRLEDFARQIIKAFPNILDMNSDEDDDELSMMMEERLSDGTDTMEGVIAILYNAAWAFAELRHRLAAYEDTGVEPEVIKIMEGHAEDMETLLDIFGQTYFDKPFFARMKELARAEKDGRLVVLPCKAGGILYEADGEHGVITHTVTDIHWVANTKAIDDAGKEWADYYTDDDISSAHPTRKEAEAALEAQKGGSE